MQETFQYAYKQLNEVQKQAVDTIDGPLLVIAGPGTGKTQLLSARVANILSKTDTLPQNILCLTFTENGAQNMRDRLTRFIGQAAYDVTISTYHGFGSDIIYRYPEYFTETRLENPVDQLGKHQILQEIVSKLSYLSPLKQLQHHIGDLVSTISEVKRALLSAADLRAIAADNTVSITQATQRGSASLLELSNASRITKKSIPLFAALLDSIRHLPEETTEAHGSVASLAVMIVDSLEAAVSEAEDSGSTKPLTIWKNTWLAKDDNNHYIFDGKLENQRIAELANVLEAYQAALAARELYDFDDMILRSIAALEQHPELTFSLQEQYLYILLDEFQDTNAAQLRLVELLTDNPVHEGRPNVMAVGDDDQAIYAFQGAEISNMLDFYGMYRGVAVLSLTQNYRSHEHIIQTAGRIAEQIQGRLHTNFSGMSKTLVAAGKHATPSIDHHEMTSDVAQYDWIAEQAQQLIQTGINPKEIAVLAPKHRFLEPLVAHLNARGIPVQYEKRENILESTVIEQLLTMARLVEALAQDNQQLADSLWPTVLSYEFWQIPVRQIWELSWQVRASQREHLEASWLEVLLSSETHQDVALLFASLALKAPTETCEAMLDYLIGSQPVGTNDPVVPNVTSMLRTYYTSETMQRSRPDLFYQTVTELKVLQTKLREHQSASGRTLKLRDLLAFVQMYEDAGEMLLNTSPYHQHSDAVQLMTVFKSKGLEFEHVFLPCLHDDVWGGSSRGLRNSLTLPANMEPIRHAGATDDERLRLLFVAITRARIGLHMTSYRYDYAGRHTKRLKYLDTTEQQDGTYTTGVLPENHGHVLHDDRQIPPLTAIELSWQTRHVDSLEDPDLRSILANQLSRYQLSPTHLNLFTDLVHGGPQEFLLRTLLRFPQAPTASGQYGNAIHETLEWAHHQTTALGKRPVTSAILAQFKKYIATKKLSDYELSQLTERGEHALRAWLAARGTLFAAENRAEHDFRNEGVFVGEAHLTGKVDYMEIDPVAKTITVVDYKTGASRTAWLATDLRLHKYRQQLYCYKILIEQSHTFTGYTVIGGRLEFIEPGANGAVQSLSLTFSDEEMARTKQLIQAVWQRVQALAFPDVSGYKPDIKGTESFENDLIAEL